MFKHRGFPSRLTGTDFHFTLRRPGKDGPTPLRRRERYADRRPADRAADAAFLAALIEHFGVPAEDPFDAESYDALLRVDLDAARRGFPDVFE